MSFDAWMEAINCRCYDRYGMSIYDLPDMRFRDEYDGGTTPEGFMAEYLSDLPALRELILS